MMVRNFCTPMVCNGKALADFFIAQLGIPKNCRVFKPIEQENA